jgi:hypothetical protein
MGMFPPGRPAGECLALHHIILPTQQGLLNRLAPSYQTRHSVYPPGIVVVAVDITHHQQRIQRSGTFSSDVLPP